jgi:hypothetical protein
MSDACQWTTTITRPENAIDVLTLTVKGVCQEPTPGYKLTLTPVNVPGTDPSTLMLILTGVAPTGTEPQHVTPTPVEYDQNFVVTQVPKKVIIFETSATINVES